MKKAVREFVRLKLLLNQVSPPIILPSIMQRGIKCRKHLWQTTKVKIVFEPHMKPGDTNYWLGEEMIIQICVHCRKVKN